MPLTYTTHTAATQGGFQANSASTYQQGGGDINFANGQLIYLRMPTNLKPYTTINSATLKINMVVKSGGTTQSSVNRIRAHASGDSPMLRVGVNEWSNGPRPETSAYTDWNPTWPGGTTALTLDVNVTTIVRELVSRADWTPGGYITFMIWNIDETGSDMGVRVNNAFQPKPLLEVDYTAPPVDVKHSINLIENSQFDPSLAPIDTTQPVPYWHQNDFFNAWVASPNLGTIARDTSFTRIAGRPTLRFTCGTPPAETNKRTGPVNATNVDTGTPTTFACWLYIPSYIPVTTNRVVAGDYWLGMNNITARGTWVPFVSNVHNSSGSGVQGGRWSGVGVNDFQAGWQFWISEPMLLEGAFRQMPFNGLSDNVLDPGGSVLVRHGQTSSKQRSYREWLPRTGVIRKGTLYRVPRYIKRPDGILQLAEPIKGGPQSSALPATAIGGYPADQTIAEL